MIVRTAALLVLLGDEGLAPLEVFLQWRIRLAGELGLDVLPLGLCEAHGLCAHGCYAGGFCR